MGLKVLIFDESLIFRYGIKQILSEEFGLVEVTHSAPVSKALDWTTGPWDVVFVTVDLPGLEKLQFIAELKLAYPDQRVIAFALGAIIPQLEGVLKGSVWRLIALESTREELVQAVREAIAGAERAILKNPDIKFPGRKELSKREREVLRLVAAGMSIKEVAAMLDVSASTISTYRVRMLRKLRLRSTAELIRYALRKRLAD
jgi:DNA-binding NarL/FixJ family response regulator